MGTKKGGEIQTPNHGRHLLLTIITCGLWLPIWFYVAAKEAQIAQPEKRTLKALAISIPVIALFSFAVAGITRGPAHIVTASEIQNPHEEQAAQAEQQKRHVDLCTWASRCSDYGKARQACATAGDFQNCVDVKMGDEPWGIDWIDSLSRTDLVCAKNGTVSSPPPDMPTKWQCIDVSIKSTLRLQ